MVKSQKSAKNVKKMSCTPLSQEDWKSRIRKTYNDKKPVEKKSEIVQLHEKVQEKSVEHKCTCPTCEKKKLSFMERFANWFLGAPEDYIK